MGLRQISPVSGGQNPPSGREPRKLKYELLIYYKSALRFFIIFHLSFSTLACANLSFIIFHLSFSEALLRALLRYLHIKRGGELDILTITFNKDYTAA